MLASDIGARSLTKCPGGLERTASYIEENFSAAGFKPSRQTYSVSGDLNDGLWGATHATQRTANIIMEILFALSNPGIMVTDTAPYRYPHYHTKEDTVDKINYDCLSRVTDGLKKVVRDLVSE